MGRGRRWDVSWVEEKKEKGTEGEAGKGGNEINLWVGANERAFGVERRTIFLRPKFVSNIFIVRV